MYKQNISDLNIKYIININIKHKFKKKKKKLTQKGYKTRQFFDRKQRTNHRDCLFNRFRDFQILL